MCALACARVRTVLLLSLGLALAAGPALATDFKFQKPTAKGKIKLGFKSLTEKCEFIEVDIAADDTAEKKAEKIKNKINSQCGTIFTATVSGATVTVKNDVHPNQKVFIHVKSDDTGEKDQIKKDNEGGWFSSGTWYEPNGTSTGRSRNTIDQGYISIGTSRHVANVPTGEGQTVKELLSLALAELNAAGVTGTELVDLGGGAAALILHPTAEDEFVEWGVDDLGLDIEFLDLPPVVKLDLLARDITYSYNDGVVEALVSASARVGTFDLPPVLMVPYEVRVNGLVVQTGEVPFGPVPTFGVDCYISSPSACNGGCPFGLDCVWVDLPPRDKSGGIDYCACDILGGLGFSVPANPGDEVSVVLDPYNFFEEDEEDNNEVSLTLPRRLDLQANALNITSIDGGVVSGMANVAALIGSEQYAPGVDLFWEIRVNGVPHVVGVEIAQVAPGFTCYVQSPPNCVGSCPPGAHSCVHAEWPTDWCACYIDFWLVWSAPAGPGDTIELVVDGPGLHAEDREDNNVLTAVIPGGVPGDRCDDPLIVGPGDTPFSNTGATTDGPPEPCGFLGDPALNTDSDIWLVHVAECSGPLTVSLMPAGFEQLLAVYHFTCPLNGGPLLACEAAPIGGGVATTLPAVAGESYVIRIGGRQGQQGTGILTIECAATPPCPGDINGDGVVGQPDLGILLGAFGTCAGHPAYVAAADLNQDGCIGQPDLGVLLSSWGECP
ncbi:MAG: hypothetical protein LC135_07685 [Phycisphaerae bacterium]|nr:hypothetical protein [Phycisphaerae bacterium]MCZ2399735.1 hypothetical protein [Phycisphaerae bacterium]NUQ49174.1 hypothetical protein [Phycisphaerae bacterium]